MGWTESLQFAIRYMEDHLLDDIRTDDIAKTIYMSPLYFQKGFKIMTGYSPSEYIRNRRLYLAALDAISGNEKVIELAYKYGYDTPESFTKAFTRFHGLSPMQIRSQFGRIKTFLPLKIRISIQGGDEMNYTIEKLQGLQVIGFERIFSFETSYQEIPKFWDEFCGQYMQYLTGQVKPADAIQKAVWDDKIGEYGICIDDVGEEGKFRYLLAGAYTGGDVPEGLTVYRFPDMEWAKFRCDGPMPAALQTVNTKIFKEWLPNNAEFEIAMGANIEWYSKGDITAQDYEAAIWIPVKRK
ncbi:AraC family transcriptional regulator [Diplocloster modestus]|uniref:AraC family transcriptional regulator n=1 Tax=Diplocloster modestus TaxID=2850322 RepID=A0ABS6KBE2_9FIRM|nr:GyrI-like domain-containing protein [Diplocloster modestus]MBU9727844.1 AraC family transcriptional regulator [Diplocloster modestus]